MTKRFLDAPNMSPAQKYYTSEIIEIDNVPEEEKVEIKSSAPVQVRINGGPWQDIRSLEQA
jgi:hypothetical protein